MRHRWRAEGDPRERYPHHRQWDRDRDWDREGGRSYPPNSAYRGREPSVPHGGGHYRDNRPPLRKRQFSRDRDVGKFYGRKRSISPARLPKPKHHHSPPQGPSEDRLGRRRDYSPSQPAKRRRTQSPSPASSARLSSESRRFARSRRSPGINDRRPPVDHPRSPFREPYPRSSRPGSPAARSQVSDRGRHVPTRPRPTSPFRNRDKRSISPRPLSRSPPPRRTESKHSTYKTPVSSVNSIPVKARPLPGQRQPTDEKDNRPSRPASIIDDDDRHSMDGHYPPYRGHHGMHRGQYRPYGDARHQGYGGSPPYSSNSSYHGSPQANSPYHNQRGGWGNPG